jgi:diguanylate cyclase (GGDEF)-like protein/PAS domain S-box-containing protein
MHSGAPPLPANEAARQAALVALRILDTPPEKEFDAIVKLASEICGVPIALVSLIDDGRQWFKARVGLATQETPRDVSYCAHAILGSETMVVPDAGADPRFFDHPLRTGEPHVEFYAGVPLRLSSGHAVGTLCVLDHAPRSLTPAQQSALEALAEQVVRLLELRRAAMLQREAVAALRSGRESLRPANDSITPAPRSHTFSLGALVLACVLGISAILASMRVRDLVYATGSERLERSAERSASFLRERAEAYAQILRGTGALFRASDRVSQEEFRRYAESLGLPRNYPGLLGLGFAERVPRSELGPWLDEVRSESPAFAVLSSGRAPELVVNRLVEPMERNAASLGFDVASHPERRRALDAALARDDVSMTSQVKLLQDGMQPGFVMYLPVPAQAAGSRGGWVFAVLRSRDLVAGMLAAAGTDVHMRVLDEGQAPLLAHGALDGDHTRALDVEITDHDVRIEVSPGESFYSDSERSEPWIILVLGLCATLLTYALATSVRKIEGHSQALAVRMTRALRRGERELRAVIDGTTDLVVTFTQEGRLTLTNRAFRDALGYDEQDLATMVIEDLVPADSRDAFHAALKRIAESDAEHLHTTFLTRSGRTIEVEGALSIVTENDQQVMRAIFRNVTARREAERALRAANEALERLATTDPLTGVANRRLFDNRMAEEVARVSRHGGELSIALVDVDCFKLYNDAYGHQQGDECLRKVAACLRASARRAGELAARYGGEEFALILPGSSADVALELADQLRASVQKLGIPHAKHALGVVTISVGVASFDSQHTGAADLIEAADAALYRAKHAGRNRVELAA